MTNLEKMINELCPNGVPFVRLDTLCKIQTES